VNPDPAAVSELVSYGATVVAEYARSGAGHRWTVMEDPQANEFCLAPQSFTGWD
jgi:hypothetical protein